MATLRAEKKAEKGGVCPLCGEYDIRLILKDRQKTYFACQTCGLRFMSPQGFLSRHEEFAHYQTHENDIVDTGYRRFLSRIAKPLIDKLTPHSSGLDYGCGPAPLLAQMLIEAGHQMALYDPFYHIDEDVLEGFYDFITCTEVAEHFHAPGHEFEKLLNMLKPGGWLSVMTCFQTEDEKFANWQYRHDPTHVVFYREETFHWLSAKFGLSLEIPQKDVVLMRKPLN